MFTTIELKTEQRQELRLITAEVQQAVADSGVQEGICLIYCTHTTAGVTANSYLDPATAADLQAEIDRLEPTRVDFVHIFDTPSDAAGHIKASLIGNHLALIIHEGQVVLGESQGLFFWEYDGPPLSPLASEDTSGLMAASFSARRRFQLFFALEYAGVAVFLPYLALYLHQVGLSGAQVGLLLGLLPLVGFLVQPLWGLLGDIYNLRRTALTIGCLGVALGAAAFGMTAEFYLLILIITFMAIMRGPIAPIGTALALEHLEGENRRDEFGSLRLWGSISFVIVSIITGAFIIEQSLGAIVWIFSAIMILLAFLSLFLPDAPVSQKAGWRDGAMLLKREPILAAFLLGILFTGMTFGIANQYLVVYLEDINATGWTIGLALAISAIPEVPLMAAVPRMMARWGLATVLIGGVAALPLRWLLYTIITNPILVLPTQVLHGIGMTALLVVAVIFVDRLLSSHWRATGQALYAAALFGIGPGIGLFSAGLLYERGGIVPVWIFATLVGLAGLAVVAWAVRAPVRQRVSAERSQP